jgi:signal transduction histidine kinase
VALDTRFVSISRLLTTASFRLTATYLAIFTTSVFVLGIVVYFSVDYELANESRERVVTETAALRDIFRTDGLDRMAEVVRSRAGGAGALDYSLTNADGRVLAGDLPSPAVRSAASKDGWIQFGDSDRDLGVENESAGEKALVTQLGSGVVLAVGEELSGFHGAKHAILIAFAWALATTIVLGLTGGLALSAAFLRRIDVMTKTAHEIVAGDLTRRIPITTAQDDLGRLASAFNRMLDRISALIEANRHVSSGIAHDLRSPLARILRVLESARSTATDLDAYAGAVDRSIEEVNNVLDTFDALLRIGQIETGARRVGFKTVDLTTILSDVAEAFQPTAADEGKSIAISPGPRVTLQGDEELLTQLVANLIDNAIRHSSVAVRIEVGCTAMADACRLFVADDGAGVPASELRPIFERFHRLDAARSIPGSGLGLSLVAAVADLHGGHAKAVDNDPGLRIVVTLPLHAATLKTKPKTLA